jgi:hypothetical protein
MDKRTKEVEYCLWHHGKAVKFYEDENASDEEFSS